MYGATQIPKLRAKLKDFDRCGEHILHVELFVTGFNRRSTENLGKIEAKATLAGF